MRRGDSHGEANSQKQQDFLHDNPDDRAGLCAKRHPDADLLGSARDDKSHDAIESDGGEQRRERAEAGGKHRDQTFGEQRIVELFAPAFASETPASKRPAFSPRPADAADSESGDPAART